MASSAENVKLNKVSSALQQLDERLRRMQEKLLPTDPYILNCPSDHRMDMRQAELWIRDTPFKRGEEHLQYVTFLARDKGDNLLRTIGAWDDGKGGMKSALQDPKAGARSGAASPMSAQAPKKKISLMDYKNKSTREAGAKAASRPVSPRPMSSANGREGAVAAIPQLPEVKVLREEALPPQKNLKRPAEGALEPHTLENETSSAVPHSPKRVRTSSPSSKPFAAEGISQDPYKGAGKIQASSPSSIDLPPLLSPTLPQIAKPPEIALPPLLSPTLPPQIEEELARQAGCKSKSEKDNRQDRKKRTGYEEQQQQQQSDSHKQAAPSNATKQKTTVEYPSPVKQVAGKQRAGEASVKSTSIAQAGQNHDRMNRKSLLVKLKIPSKFRKRVAIILGAASPKPKRPINGFRSEEGRAAEAREKEKETKNEKGESAERPGREGMTNGAATGKRQGDHHSSPSLSATTKRHKTTNSQDSTFKPKDPSRRRPPPPPPKSPEPPQNGCVSKSYLPTPLKDLKSAAMNRIRSSDSDVKTPLGSLRSSTPTTIPEGRPPSSTSSSTNGGSSKSEEITALKQESTRFQDLGRKLKHESKNLMGMSNATAKDNKESAALAVESILCFMLAFRLLDELNRSTSRSTNTGDRSSWRSLLPLLGQTRRSTATYPYILGLTCQIEAVCRDLIHELDVEQLCGNRLLSEPVDSPSRRKELATLRDDLLENMRQSSRMWAQGLDKLSKESLRKDFREIWDAQAKAPVMHSPGKNREKLVARQYREEGYYLPLGPTSSIMEVVRFGLKVLDEWTEKEGLEWQSRMGI